MAHRVFVKLSLLIPLFAAWAVGALAQQTPSGSAVLNQGLYSAAVTPSDTQVLSVVTRALYNGNTTACTISIKLAKDAAAVMWQNVQPGEILPVSALYVMSTNTSCANIVAIW